MSPRRPSPPDLREPRSTAEVLVGALKTFGSDPALFLTLSLLVVAPYDAVAIIVTHGHASTAQVVVLGIVNYALVQPLVSTLQMQALLARANRDSPHLLRTIARSLRVLPVVAAAQIIADLCIFLGFFLIIPGVLLALRWSVVAQVASVEQTDWPNALRRSRDLTAGNYSRILVLVVILILINLLLGNVSYVGGDGVLVLALAIAIEALVRAIESLVYAVLYYDLTSRHDGA